MKRCTVVCAGRLPFTGSGVQIQPRLWHSYAKPTLTREALLKRIESQLGHDLEGRPLRVDPDSKTVTTAVGSLPISPVMDPAWIKTKRQPRKNNPGKISGQFRKKLSNNPFAEALMTPLRRCMNTESLLPRYFLQDMEVVTHPEHPSQHWVAPGPFSLDSVVPVYNSGPWSPTGQAHTNPGNRHEKLKTSQENRVNEPPSEADNTKPDTSSAEINSLLGRPQKERRTQSPLTIYCLSRRSVLDALSGVTGKPGRALRHRMLALRTGMISDSYKFADAIWRPNMGDVILKHQRRTVVDALIHRAARSKDPDFRFLQPVNDWDEVKDVEKRGCVLWFADRVDPITDSFATIDVKDARWWRKMPVHNLTWLLGEEEVKRLRESSDIFKNNDIVVLKLWRSESMRKLHLLLWRMQGFLAQIRTPEVEEPGTEELEQEADEYK